MNNSHNLPLSITVWLASDSYDHSNNEKTLSATGLLKSPKQIILSSRCKGADKKEDVMDMVASRMGSDIHDSIESVWKDPSIWKTSMRRLKYPESLIERIEINPTEVPKEGSIPLYMELREHKQLGDWTISGKFDFILDGRIQDFKSTGTYTYTNGHKEQDYIWQASIYRWLNQERITDDHFDIIYIFTNWSKLEALKDKTGKYPKQRIVTKSFPLKSPQETENFIKQKLQFIEKYWDLPEAEMPPCTDVELARKASVYKYYAKPDAARATKVFDSMQEAYQYQLHKGLGSVREIKGAVYTCRWCPAASICKQRDSLVSEGALPVS